MGKPRMITGRLGRWHTNLASVKFNALLLEEVGNGLLGHWRSQIANDQRRALREQPWITLLPVAPPAGDVKVSSNLRSCRHGYLRHLAAVGSMKSDPTDFGNTRRCLFLCGKLDECVASIDTTARTTGKAYDVVHIGQSMPVQQRCQAVLAHAVWNIAQHQCAGALLRMLQSGWRLGLQCLLALGITGRSGGTAVAFSVAGFVRRSSKGRPFLHLEAFGSNCYPRALRPLFFYNLAHRRHILGPLRCGLTQLRPGFLGARSHGLTTQCLHSVHRGGKTK
mmetsp:Transcript_1036/g.2066  ORF Transcript_1036/g.2066 Transcript_1036/m.2066 type:complete len:279 (-) Transcript_1036:18-854(-)